jgi:hypothetical protein
MPVERMIRTSVVAGRSSTVISSGAEIAWLLRSSDEHGSVLEAGEVGALGRHSQRGTGELRVGRAGITTDFLMGAGLDTASAGTQQQAAQTRPMQQARALFREATVDVEAEASPTTENRPMIAARATQGSRK